MWWCSAKQALSLLVFRQQWYPIARSLIFSRPTHPFPTISRPFPLLPRPHRRCPSMTVICTLVSTGPPALCIRPLTCASVSTTKARFQIRAGTTPFSHRPTSPLHATAPAWELSLPRRPALASPAFTSAWLPIGCLPRWYAPHSLQVLFVRVLTLFWLPLSTRLQYNSHW